MSKKEFVSTDNLDLLLNVLPDQIRAALAAAGKTESLIEVVLDLGRLPEARYPGRALYLNQSPITHEDIQFVASRVGNFTRDNRAGIERTLHRISAIRNRLGEIVGLTCRVGRAIYGTVDIIRDVVESGKSILLMGKPGVGKCITGNSLLLTADGFRELSELMPSGLGADEFAPLETLTVGMNGLEHTSQAYNGGFSETIKLTSAQGFTLEGTPEHAVLALTRFGELAFRRLDELNVDDYVAIQRGQQTFGYKTSLPAFDFIRRTNAVDCQLPATLTEELARFLGYLIAEGTLSIDDVIYFSNTDVEVQSEMAHLTQSLFGLQMRPHLYKGVWNKKDFRIFGVKLRRFLERLGLGQSLADGKTIPSSILRAPKKIAIAFLQALFEGDGSIWGNRVEISSASEKLLRQLHIVLLNFGIVGNLRIKHSPLTDKNYFVLTLMGDNVIGFADEIGFISKVKREKLAAAVAAMNAKSRSPNLDVLPHQNYHLRELRAQAVAVSNGFQRFTRADNRAPSYRSLHKILNEISYLNSDPVYQKLQILADYHFYFDSVKNLEKNVAQVYDICVPVSHSFFANGFISHNTTLLREAARVLADDLEKRVIVVDTSNEIAGDGDVPHSGIGRARRMQVPDPEHQHSVMIEAVENHMPEVIVIDEIGTSQEALAARTIAERGVQLIATVHGNTLENLLVNPTLSDLVGGIHAVTLSDEEARRRGTQKTVLERKAPPTFDVLIEIKTKDSLAIHQDVARAVDQMLRGYIPQIENRERSEDGDFTITQPEPAKVKKSASNNGMRHSPLYQRHGEANGNGNGKPLRIFPYALSRERLQRTIDELGVKATIVDKVDEADVLLTLKAHAKRQSQKLRDAQGRDIEVHILRSNTITQMENFLRAFCGVAQDSASENIAMQEVEDAVLEAVENRRVVALTPQPRHIRKKQHLYIERSGLISKSKGLDPMRHIVVYPR